MACSRSFIEPQYTLYRFSIYSRIFLVCSNDNSNKNCCNCVIILLLFNNLGNIANCAQQESRTPVQPSRPGLFSCYPRLCCGLYPSTPSTIFAAVFIARSNIPLSCRSGQPSHSQTSL